MYYTCIYTCVGYIPVLYVSIYIHLYYTCCTHVLNVYMSNICNTPKTPGTYYMCPLHITRGAHFLVYMSCNGLPSVFHKNLNVDNLT